MENGSVLWIISAVLLLLATPGCPFQRTLRSWVNPDCDSACEKRNSTTVYLRADGPNDTLHYLWDFSGDPAVLLAVTGPASFLNISWPDFIARKPGSIRFTEEPVYTFGVLLNKIIEFNDLNDTGAMNTAFEADETTNYLRPMYFKWNRKRFSQSEEYALLEVEGSSYYDATRNITRKGAVKLSLRGYCSMDHDELMPHMLHTENSTQVDLVLDKLETNTSFANSRFGVELLVVGGGDANVPMFVDPKKSLDDEHTPGIFEVFEVRTPPYESTDHWAEAGAYLQWRPVSYTTSARDVSNSIETSQYPPLSVPSRLRRDALRNSMLYTYYGPRVEEMLLQRVAVSFGVKGDQFYRTTRYSTWTFLVGYGTPPEERFSYLVIMIISIGLGLPVLILSCVSLYICLKRISNRGSMGAEYLTN